MKLRLRFSPEFLYQVFALVLALILVHAVYVGLIRPRATAFLVEQHSAMQADPTYVAQRSPYVLVKDYEQEACLIMMLWAFAIMGWKGWSITRDKSLLDENLIPVREGMKILPEDTRELSRKIQALPESRKRALLPRALLAALHRFESTRNVQDVAEATRAYCESEGERLESELSMIRYIAWAIPSIGFIGTVRGISEALGQAHQAVQGDISGVVQSLGVAFNSTFIALVISIVLMFIVHQLQLLQERYVLEAEAYCEESLTRHLHTR